MVDVGRKGYPGRTRLVPSLVERPGDFTFMLPFERFAFWGCAGFVSKVRGTVQRVKIVAFRDEIV